MLSSRQKSQLASQSKRRKTPSSGGYHLDILAVPIVMVTLQRRDGYPPKNLHQILILMLPYMHQKSMKRLIIHVMRLSGESRQVPKQVQKWVEITGKED